MWEDERAPAWRRKLVLWRALTGAVLALLVAAGVGLVATDSPWFLIPCVIAVGGLIRTWDHVLTYKGRLERPARKAQKRAAKAQRRERALSRHSAER